MTLILKDDDLSCQGGNKQRANSSHPKLRRMGARGLPSTFAAQVKDDQLPSFSSTICKKYFVFLTLYKTDLPGRIVTFIEKFKFELPEPHAMPFRLAAAQTRQRRMKHPIITLTDIT